MITSGATSLRILFRENLAPVLFVLLVIAAVEVSDKYFDYITVDRPGFSLTALGLLTTAFSIFLVFRVNEAYGRWWEARILWGGVVNYSRTFARQVTTLLTGDDDELRQWKQELVYRHVAYINAVRKTLRREEDWQDLSDYIPAEELADLKTKANKATAATASRTGF